MEAVRNLDGVSFADWFRSHGGSQGSIDMMWDPIGTPPHPHPPCEGDAEAPMGPKPQSSDLLQ